MKAIGLSFLLCAAMLILPERLKAQMVLLEGVVAEKAGKDRIPDAEISNLRTHKTVKSNRMGVFQIIGAVGDTLVVRKAMFVDAQMLVRNAKEIQVYLNPAIKVLEEVTIKGQSKKEELNSIGREFKRNGSFYSGKPPLVLLSPFGGSPLTFFYELFGKSPARARRFNKYWASELKEMEVDRFFNPALVEAHTTLKGEKLEQFMMNCRPEYKEVSHWTDYDAVKYIKDTAKKFADTSKHL